MPELPEVETLVRGLQPAVGATIQTIEVLDDRLELDPRPLIGATILAISRRGKHIVIRLGESGDLVVHLRMSGRLSLARRDAEIAYTRLILGLSTDLTVYFVNPRRLGTVAHCPTGFDDRLGIEPLDRRFTPEALAELVRGSRAPIKTFLLNQAKIAGIGNIYAAESLWHAGIDPRRPAADLGVDEIARLHRALTDVLSTAVDQLGTTIGSSVSDYRPGGEESARYQNKLYVYGREGEPCERCGESIERIVQAGRSTCLCPACQH